MWQCPFNVWQYIWSTNMNLYRNIVLLSDYPSLHELSQSCPCTYIDLHNETIQSVPESLLDTNDVSANYVQTVNYFCISPQIVTLMFPAAILLFIAIPLSLATNGKLWWLYQVRWSRNTVNTIQTWRIIIMFSQGQRCFFFILLGSACK